MNTTQREKSIKELFLGKCWKYLDDNFHKFAEPQQIKIALAVCTKDIPQEIQGELTHKVVEMPVIRRGGQPLEYLIGSN